MKRRLNKKVRRKYRGSLDGLQEAKDVVLYSVLGVGAAVGLGLIGRHYWNKIFQNKAQKTNLNEGDASTFATKLYMAMGNEHWYSSADKTQIFDLLRSIPSKAFFDTVQNKYKANYGTNLTADLEKRLTPSEYNLSVLIKSSKPDKG